MELLADERSATRRTSSASGLATASRSTTCCPRRSRSVARRRGEPRPASLRRPADRRHGAARRRDRRDEDRRGQDADRHAGGVPQLARRRRRPPGHRQRLPGPSRRRVDGADLRRAGGQRRRDPVAGRTRDSPAGLRLRRRLRHQLGVRLRLPARQHGGLAGALRAARARLRDRRRGRQHPDRRGAHAADHLRRPRGRGRPVLHLRPPRQAAGRGTREAEAEVARRGQRHHRRGLRLRVRREAQDGRPDRAGGGEGGAVPGRRQPLRVRARHPGQPPDPVAEGGVAVSPRRRLRGDRRRGEDRRRVHRPHPRGAPLVGGAAPGDRGEGGRLDPGGEPDPGHDHAPELLPPLRQALRDDRHRADRGAGVHEDLRDTGDRHPDQRADGSR